MSFTMFGVEFDGRKDCNSVGEKKQSGAHILELYELNLMVFLIWKRI